MAGDNNEPKGVFDKLGELVARAFVDLAHFFLTKCLFPFMDRIGGELLGFTPELIDNMLENPDIPEEVKEILTKAREKPGQSTAVLGSLLVGGAVGGGVSATLFAPLERAKQRMAAKLPFAPVPIVNLIILKFRKLITEEFFFHEMSRFGVDGPTALLMLNSYAFYPAPQDLITWIAKEVFEPDMIEKFGLKEELPADKIELFNKAGVDMEQLTNFWVAHWLHPGFGELARLYHRDQVTQETFWEWFKMVEIPPIYRDGLIEITWDTPNRIETRMMCRYLDMKKEDVVKLLQYAGLKEEYRSDAADFMIIMGIESDLRTRYRNGWITEQEIKSELTSRGIGTAMATRIYQRIVKEEKPAKVAAERDLTKAEIYAGVKKGVISWADGLAMIMELGYDEWEAQFILEVRVGELTGSPKDKAEFMRLTELAQAASGAPTKRPLKEIAEAGAKLLEERGKTRVPTEEEVKIETDTIRRKRRKNLISRVQELDQLLALGWDPAYANAAADNDDIRLAEKASEE